MVRFDDDKGASVAERVDGLGPNERYRCEACGNVTRFDVVSTTRARRFHHLDLSGDGQIEEEEIFEHRVEQVSCRWCGRSDAVTAEPRPGPASDTPSLR